MGTWYPVKRSVSHWVGQGVPVRRPKGGEAICHYERQIVRRRVLGKRYGVTRDSYSSPEYGIAELPPHQGRVQYWLGESARYLQHAIDELADMERQGVDDPWLREYVQAHRAQSTVQLRHLD